MCLLAGTGGIIARPCGMESSAEREAFGMALSLAAVRRCTSIWRSSLRNMLPSGAKASRRVGRAKSMSISVSTMMGRAVLRRLGR